MTWTLFVLTCISIVIHHGLTSVTLLTLPPVLQQPFKGKCERNGHPEVFQNVESIFQTFSDCSITAVDKNLFEAQTKRAVLDGNYDEVFKTLCNIYKKSDKCFREMTEAIKPCFSAEEQKNFKTIFKVEEELVAEFVCYKDGNRIAQFIAEGGPKCIGDKQNALQACFNKVFDPQTQGNIHNMTMDDYLDLEITEEDCNIMTKLQHCVVGVFETCNKPTATNFVDLLFNVVRRATPCNHANSASSFAVTTGTVLMALTAAILV